MSGYTQAQLDALRAAASSGVLTVRHADGKSVTYQSLSELRALIRSIEVQFSGSTFKTHINPEFRRA